MTLYSSIFDRFLIKIEDFSLLNNFDENEITFILNKYLEGAIVRFSTICKKDLSKRSKEAQMFDVCLNDMEQEILSLFMVVEWIKPYVNNRLNVRQFLGDQDFKVYSQSNFLKELQELQKNIQIQAEELQKEYSWSDFDYTEFK